jgi:hypothetical protein
MSTKVKFWTLGVLLAAIGLILVRVVSGQYTDEPAIQLVVYFVGVALALAGLVIILAGIRHK